MKLDVVDILLLIVLFILILSCIAVIFIRGSIDEFRHNLDELEDLISCQTKDADDAHEIINELTESQNKLQLQNERLSEELISMKNENEEFRKIIIDYEIAANSKQEEPEPAATKKEILQANAKERLPEGHTNVISGMPYTTITNKKSEQWALQLQAFTGKYGIRCYFDGEHIYFLAAMGSAYGRTVGDAFKVTLKCGTEFYAMLGEFKDDGTDPNFFGHPTKHADGYDVTCVLEFIYDAEHINSKALQAGNFCNIEFFGNLHGYGGDIVKIEYLGRKWVA